MKLSKPQLYLKFFGSSTPFIVTKIKPTTIDSFYRPGFEIFSNMAGIAPMYYITGLPYPISHRNMTVSVFLTQLTRLFKPRRDSEDSELCIYLGASK